MFVVKCRVWRMRVPDGILRRGGGGFFERVVSLKVFGWVC